VSATKSEFTPRQVLTHGHPRAFRVGGVVGGAIGGPFNAAIGQGLGALAGSAIDSALFASSGPRIEGRAPQTSLLLPAPTAPPSRSPTASAPK
jgi:outer membrane lipoprotein SlyB